MEPNPPRRGGKGKTFLVLIAVTVLIAIAVSGDQGRRERAVARYKAKYPDSALAQKVQEKVQEKPEEKPTERPAAKAAPAAPTRQDLIEAQFSPWNGAHRELERIIKRGMNDPKSFEHVRTTYADMGNYLFVKTTFRGRNSFGGMVINTVGAKFGLDGEFIELVGQIAGQ